jgi:outer membrane protein OmpA-like peptidoglycan-associated protein
MQRKIKSILLIPSLLIFFLLTTGCCPQICPHEEPPKSPCELLIDSLRADGIQVIQLGDKLRLILPSDKFFEPASTKIKPKYDYVFANIAQLTCCYCYGILPITITGYTDTMGTIPEQYQRSLKQARNVAAYLWANKIPLSRMRIRGCGAERSIASNETPRGEAFNRRIEITLP